MSFSRRDARRLWCVSFAVGASCAVELVHAEEGDGARDLPVAIELTYDAPPGCGSKSDVLQRVERLTHGPNPTPLMAVVEVTVSDGAYELRYDAQHAGTRSRRQLTVTDCAAVVEASALLLTLTLEPASPEATPNEPSGSRVETQVDPNTPPSSAPTSPAAARPPLPAPRAPTTQNPETSAPFRGWVGMGSEVASSLTPNVAIGVRGEAGAGFGPLNVVGALSYDWTADERVREVPGARLQSSLWRLQLSGGPAVNAGALSFVPRVGVGVNYMDARVSEVSKPSPGGSFWWSVLGGGEVRWQLWAKFAVKLQAGLILNVQRPKFTILGVSEVVHQPQLLGVDGNVGVVWSWGAH